MGAVFFADPAFRQPRQPVCCVVVAGVIQLVECQLPKLDVAGSSPVARSRYLQNISRELTGRFGTQHAEHDCFAREPGLQLASRSALFVSYGCSEPLRLV